MASEIYHVIQRHRSQYVVLCTDMAGQGVVQIGMIAREDNRVCWKFIPHHGTWVSGLHESPYHAAMALKERDGVKSMKLTDRDNQTRWI